MSDAPDLRRSLPAVAALVAITAIWGATFVVVKRAVEEVPPLEFLAIRFSIATAVLAAAFPRQAAGALRAPRASIWIGTALAVGYAFQTVGLVHTTATNAGFITGLFVVFTPVVGAVVSRRLPSPAAVLAVLLAGGGLALLLIGDRFEPRAGDGLVLITAVAFAVHIVVLGRFAPGFDPRTLAIGQLGVATVGFAAVSAVTERMVAPTSRQVWLALLLTSLGASAAGYLVQTWAQRTLSPTRTAVTLTMEPVFAGLTGYVVLGERLGLRGLIGASMILAGMLVADLRRPRPKEV